MGDKEQEASESELNFFDQLDEALEERKGTDRRKADQGRGPDGEDRRKGDRRQDA